MVDATQTVPVDCAGTWSDPERVPGSESACVDGSRTYQTRREFSVVTPPSGGGAACPVSPELATVSESCVVVPDPVDCVGTWSDPVRVPGSETACVDGSRTYQARRDFAITTPPDFGGVACPSSPEITTQPEPCTVTPPPLPPTTGPTVAIAGNGRMLLLNGAPWYWLGDTAWRLHEVATAAELAAYFDDRQARGVRVVQGPIIHVLEGPPVLAAGGATLNPEKFAPIDLAVRLAGARGILMTLAIVWGPQNDTTYPAVTEHVRVARLIAQRYATQAHVQWIAAGEYHKITWSPDPAVPGGWITNSNPITAEQKDRYLRVMRELLAHSHPNSRTFMHADGWRYPGIDFQSNPENAANMLQPAGSMAEVVRGVQLERNRQPPRPVINAETGYEDAEDGPPLQRAFAWYTAFSAASGYTFGNQKVWKGREGWQAEIDSAGAREVLSCHGEYMRRWHRTTAAPAQARVVDPGEPGEYFVAALRDSADNKVMHAYTANGRAFSLKTDTLDAGSIRGRWIGPRSCTEQAEFPVSRGPSVLFDPPGAVQFGNDWVLRLTVLPAVGAAPFRLPIQEPTENEDGSEIRAPLRMVASGAGADLPTTRGSDGWFAQVPAGVESITVRAVDADGLASEPSQPVEVR